MDVINTISQNLIIYLIWVGVFSLLIGSFLNVLIYRLPVMLDRENKMACKEYLALEADEEQAPFNLFLPLSRCGSCNNTLKPWHNIPVFSFLLQGGKCAYCQSKIAWRYPLVEIMTCILSIMVAWRFGFTWQALAALFFTWFMIALTFIDIDHQILPDLLTYSLLWIGLFVSLFHLFVSPYLAIIGALAGYLVFWLFAFVFRSVTKKEGLGYGDFKLLAAIGVWLGWQMLPLVVLFSAFVAIIWALLFMLVTRKNIRGIPIPFGPFLAVAGWIGIMWGPQILIFYLNSVIGS